MKPMLVHNGYRYIRDCEQKDTIYWCCKEKRTKEKCGGRAKTIGNDVIVTQAHSCVPTPTAVEATRLRSNILRTATNSTNSPRTVINECLAGASDPTIAALPKFESLATVIRRKRKSSILNQIDDNRRPMMFIIDFEKATENAIRALLPEKHIHGCWFHFNQSVWRSIQSRGMAERYGQEQEYAAALKKFSVLAFCDVQDVRPRFEHLADNFLEQFGDTQPHQFFLEYMENTWIGRHRRNPLFPKEMWNAKDITEFQLPRTTNSIESWHKILQNTFGCLHPNFFRFMDGILNENLRANAICVKLDASEEVPIYSRVEYMQSNQRLLNIINDYQNRDEVDYLAQCIYYIHFN
uniref:FLYWCH-type domain-containing protein n=2 Tax=Meloidogyne TaxID=189290 RepID=A0A914KLN5_MELIC